MADKSWRAEARKRWDTKAIRINGDDSMPFLHGAGCWKLRFYQQELKPRN